MAEDVDKNLRLLYLNAFLRPTFLIHATHFGVTSVAGISDDGKVEFFGRKNEREMAADTLAKARLLLIVMGIAINAFFDLGADSVMESMGKKYSVAWPVQVEGR